MSEIYRVHTRTSGPQAVPDVVRVIYRRRARILAVFGTGDDDGRRAIFCQSSSSNELSSANFSSILRL